MVAEQELQSTECLGRKDRILAELIQLTCSCREEQLATVESSRHHNRQYQWHVWLTRRLWCKWLHIKESMIMLFFFFYFIFFCNSCFLLSLFISFFSNFFLVSFEKNSSCLTYSSLISSCYFCFSLSSSFFQLPFLSSFLIFFYLSRFSFIFLCSFLCF